MLSEIEFASLANYHSRGASEHAVRSRQLCGSLKSGNAATLKSVAERLKDPQFASLQPFLASDRILVPVPGSGKTTPGNLWAPSLICGALKNAGFGGGVDEILKRETAVPKSAFASAGNRPTPAKHFASMSAEKTLYVPDKITLVDDVITKGSTTMGAYLRLREAFPSADIQVFSVFKTCNFQPDIDAVLAPTVGKLRYEDITDHVVRID